MSDPFQMDRRGLLERMLALTGASAAMALSPAALAKVAKEKPSLDAKNFALLSAVSDTIIPRTDSPGAVDARVPAKFDALLVNWASPERRVELTEAMNAIDRAAKEKEGKAFADLTPEKRKEFLVPYDVAALKAVPRQDKLTGMRALLAGPAVADPGYAKMRELIIVLYYYSEEALTTELVYEHSPGGWTPSVPATPETRATGGLGMF